MGLCYNTSLRLSLQQLTHPVTTTLYTKINKLTSLGEPPMQPVTFFCHCLLLLGLLFLPSVSSANTYGQTEIDWANALSLSPEQQQQIKKIEQAYRQQHQVLKKRHCRAEEKNQEKTTRLKQRMHKDIHNILTTEQKQQASVIIQDQHRQMQLRHARELAYQLNMGDRQKLSFLNAVEDVQYRYQWPLNLEQRKLARTLFEQILTQHLNDDQLAQWQTLSDQHSKKWLKSDEFKPKCSG